MGYSKLCNAVDNDRSAETASGDNNGSVESMAAKRERLDCMYREADDEFRKYFDLHTITKKWKFLATNKVLLELARKEEAIEVSLVNMIMTILYDQRQNDAPWSDASYCINVSDEFLQQFNDCDNNDDKRRLIKEELINREEEQPSSQQLSSDSDENQITSDEEQSTMEEKEDKNSDVEWEKTEKETEAVPEKVVSEIVVSDDDPSKGEPVKEPVKTVASSGCVTVLQQLYENLDRLLNKDDTRCRETFMAPLKKKMEEEDALPEDYGVYHTFDGCGYTCVETTLNVMKKAYEKAMEGPRYTDAYDYLKMFLQVHATASAEMGFKARKGCPRGFMSHIYETTHALGMVTRMSRKAHVACDQKEYLHRFCSIFTQMHDAMLKDCGTLGEQEEMNHVRITEYMCVNGSTKKMVKKLYEVTGKLQDGYNIDMKDAMILFEEIVQLREDITNAVKKERSEQEKEKDTTIGTPDDTGTSNHTETPDQDGCVEGHNLGVPYEGIDYGTHVVLFKPHEPEEKVESATEESVEEDRPSTTENTQEVHLTLLEYLLTLLESRCNQHKIKKVLSILQEKMKKEKERADDEKVWKDDDEDSYYSRGILDMLVKRCVELTEKKEGDDLECYRHIPDVVSAIMIAHNMVHERTLWRKKYPRNDIDKFLRKHGPSTFLGRICIFLHNSCHIIWTSKTLYLPAYMGLISYAHSKYLEEGACERNAYAEGKKAVVVPSCIYQNMDDKSAAEERLDELCNEFRASVHKNCACTTVSILFYKMMYAYDTLLAKITPLPDEKNDEDKKEDTAVNEDAVKKEDSAVDEDAVKKEDSTVDEDSVKKEDDVNEDAVMKGALKNLESMVSGAYDISLEQLTEMSSEELIKMSPTLLKMGPEAMLRLMKDFIQSNESSREHMRKYANNILAACNEIDDKDAKADDKEEDKTEDKDTTTGDVAPKEWVITPTSFGCFYGAQLNILPDMMNRLLTCNSVRGVVDMIWAEPSYQRVVLYTCYDRTLIQSIVLGINRFRRLMNLSPLEEDVAEEDLRKEVNQLRNENTELKKNCDVMLDLIDNIRMTDEHIYSSMQEMLSNVDEAKGVEISTLHYAGKVMENLQQNLASNPNVMKDLERLVYSGDEKEWRRLYKNFPYLFREIGWERILSLVAEYHEVDVFVDTFCHIWIWDKDMSVEEAKEIILAVAQRPEHWMIDIIIREAYARKTPFAITVNSDVIKEIMTKACLNDNNKGRLNLLLFHKCIPSNYMPEVCKTVAKWSGMITYETVDTLTRKLITTSFNGFETLKRRYEVDIVENVMDMYEVAISANNVEVLKKLQVYVNGISAKDACELALKYGVNEEMCAYVLELLLSPGWEQESSKNILQRLHEHGLLTCKEDSKEVGADNGIWRKESY